MVQPYSVEVQATNTINTLKALFTGDRLALDLLAGQYIAGDDKRALRQEICRQITGERRPQGKCTVLAVSDVLHASFHQYSLFAQPAPVERVTQPVINSRAWFEFLAK